MKIYLIHGSPISGIEKFNPNLADDRNLNPGVSGGLFGTYFYWCPKFEQLDIFVSNVRNHAKGGSIYYCEYDLGICDANKPLLKSDDAFNPIMLSEILTNIFPELPIERIEESIKNLSGMNPDNFKTFSWLSQQCRKLERLSEFIKFVSKETSGIIIGESYGTAVFFDASKIKIIKETKI